MSTAGRVSTRHSLCVSETAEAALSPRARIARIFQRTVFDVLTLLRELEESTRVSSSDDAYDAHGDRSWQGRVVSPTEPSDVQTDASFLVFFIRASGGFFCLEIKTRACSAFVTYDVVLESP